MPRKVVFRHKWSTPLISAHCTVCEWQWHNVAKLRVVKTSASLRAANAAEKHAECLGHTVVMTRTRIVKAGERLSNYRTRHERI